MSITDDAGIREFAVWASSRTHRYLHKYLRCLRRGGQSLAVKGIASSSYDNTVRFWDAGTGKEIEQLKERPQNHSRLPVASGLLTLLIEPFGSFH